LRKHLCTNIEYYLIEIKVFICTSFVVAARIAAYLENGSQQCAGKLKDSYSGVQSSARNSEHPEQLRSLSKYSQMFCPTKEKLIQPGVQLQKRGTFK
jgi:hypothetical protein